MSFFRTYLMPGFIFQSVMIGGGYATGREIVEYFLSAGPVTGLLGMIVSTIIFSLVLAISFEFGRTFKAYDYRAFFQKLLGPFGWLYEVAYIIMLILILSVLGAAAGSLVAASFATSPILGTLIFAVVSAIIVFYGTNLLEMVLSAWSFLLYATYAAVFIMAFVFFGQMILDTLGQDGVQIGIAFSNGASYAGYNISVVPALLFCITQIKTRKQALTAGILGGPIGMIPGFLMYFALLTGYPSVVGEEVPSDYLMTIFDQPVLRLIFQIVIFGTFIETGAALIHGLNERLAHAVEARGKIFPDYARTASALFVIVISVWLANSIGLVDLIASGYGTLTYAFWAVYAIPLLTLGVWKLFISHKEKQNP